MGFLLVCIGVQFIGLAIAQVVGDERVLAAILEVVEELRGACQR